MFHMTVYERGLSAFRIFAVATAAEAKKVNILVPLDDEARSMVEYLELRSAFIIDLDKAKPLTKAMLNLTNIWKDHSVMVIHLDVKGARPGNLILWAKGTGRYTEEHLRLYSMLNEPFAIAMSNALRYDELNRLKEIMADDLQYLHRKLQRSAGEIIIGEDFGLKKVMEMVRGVAPLDSAVLLQGETGVGKEIIANAIHHFSQRRQGPFIQVNCGAIPETLIDSELFGHEKGAFTGAIEQKRGCFERADGGDHFSGRSGRTASASPGANAPGVAGKGSQPRRRDQAGSRSIFASSPPLTRTSKPWSGKTCSGPTCASGLPSFPSPFLL